VDRPIEQRTFTDREVEAILEKAVEQQPMELTRTQREAGGADGLTLADLKSIAQEVGIDPARLEAAARAVVASQGRGPSGLLGGPTRWHFERSTKGELTPEDAAEVLSVIRRAMGHHGKVSQLHGSLEWSHSGESGSRHVTVSSKNGATVINASANLSQLAIVTYLPAGILGAFAAAMVFIASAEAGNAIGMVAGAAILPTLVGVMRSVFRRFTFRESARLQRAVDELARLAPGDQDPSDRRPGLDADT
jgi:hypothetical protein